MATCFRVVSNRLCSSVFFKNTSYLLLEHSAADLRKSVQLISVRVKSNSSNATVRNRFTSPTQFCCSDNAYHSPILANSTISSASLSALYGNRNDQNAEPYALYSYGKVLSNSAGNKTDNIPGTSEGRPSDEQLQTVLNVLSQYLEKMFSRPLPVDIFHKDVILENNIRKTRHVGVNKYIYQVGLLRMLSHMKFAYVKFHILKITKHPEDGTIKCRWRIVGIYGSTIIFQFWKFKPSSLRKEIENAPTWYDGFSIYYVGSDGLIRKHIIDKMMPDDNHISSIDKSSIAPKVALCVGLCPQEEQTLLLRKM